MKKIAVIGSINMDMTAAADRIPLKGETISATGLQYIPGGKGANQAVAAARLGGDVTMFGCVGDDAFCGKLLENLRENGVNTDHIDILPDESSGLAMIVVAENDNVITVIPGANALVTTAYIDTHWDEITEADIVLLQNEIPMESVRYAARLLHETGKTVIYNPAPAAKADALLVGCATYLTPNEHEARIVLGDETTPLDELMRKYDGKLIVTLGSKGVGAAQEGEIISIPAQKVNVVDTTGAGDTMNGAFAYALSVDMPFEQALAFANAAAGLSTEKHGAQAGMPTYDAVAKKLKKGGDCL